MATIEIVEILLSSGDAPVARRLIEASVLRAIWHEWIGESGAAAEDLELSDAELAAVYNLARTRAEQRAVEKLMALVSG